MAPCQGRATQIATLFLTYSYNRTAWDRIFSVSIERLKVHAALDA